MVKYNKINTKLSSQKVNKIKLAVKNNGWTTFRIDAKNFNEQDLPHKLFLTTRQMTNIRNTTENNFSADIKLSKTQLKKILISGGSILSIFVGPLLKSGFSLLKSVVKPLGFLGLSAASSLMDNSIAKKYMTLEQ